LIISKEESNNLFSETWHR